ncbi:helix-turn-helix domain-containing protein [Carnobacterium divergens]
MSFIAYISKGFSFIIYYYAYISNHKEEIILKEKMLEIKIHNLLKAYNISLSELSRLSDIEVARLSELANGKRQRIQINHLVRIAEALDIDDISEIIQLKNVE